MNRTHIGDCRALLREMAIDGVRVQCVVTSPPYWGLRDYGVPGQFGLERTWLRHVARMRGVFRLVRAALAIDGVLWLNYGDSYHTGKESGGIGENSTINGKGNHEEFRKANRARHSRIVPPDVRGPNRRRQMGLKPKDLIGMPWRVALALQADGWWLRSDIVWHKPNPMPESIQDRPTKAHEYVFLLAKSAQYYYDAAAIRDPAHPRGHGINPKVQGWAYGPGSHSAKDHARAKQALRDSTKFGRGAGWRQKQNASFSAAIADLVAEKNARTVWTIPTQPYEGAHFATFPQGLVARCILASSRPGDVVLDPFMGSGTVGKVATDLGRNFIGCELNPEYVALHELRRTTIGMQL